MAIKLACNSGNGQCLIDTSVQTGLHAQNTVRVRRGLEQVTFCGGLRGSGDKQATWVALWQEMQLATDTTFKSQVIAGLGCIEDQVVLKDYLESTLGSSNNVNYTQAQRREVLAAVLTSYTGFEVVINFIRDFELDIMSSFGYTLEQLLTVPANAAKQNEQSVMFTDFILTLDHLDVAASTRLTTIAGNNLRNQETSEFSAIIRRILGIDDDDTTTPETTASSSTENPTDSTTTATTTSSPGEKE